MPRTVRWVGPELQQVKEWKACGMQRCWSAHRAPHNGPNWFKKGQQLYLQNSTKFFKGSMDFWEIIKILRYISNLSFTNQSTLSPTWNRSASFRFFALRSRTLQTMGPINFWSSIWIIIYLWSSPSVSTFFPISEFSNLVIRFLNHIFLSLTFPIYYQILL